MGKDDNLHVTSFTLGGHTTHAGSRRGVLLDDGIAAKILRGKTLVLEWAQLESTATMHTTRTKVEVALCDAVGAALISGELTMQLKKPPQMFIGSQPFDHAKRQRGKCSWGGALGPGDVAPLHRMVNPAIDLFDACCAATELRVSLTNKEEKLRRTLAPLLDPAAASAATEAKKSKKRDLCDADLGRMSVSQINKLLRTVQQSPSPAAPSRQMGSGGARCDGCNAEGDEAEDLSTCERCQYSACDDCQCHHSRGTCHCKDSNFGSKYPAKREWYHTGSW